MEEPNHMRLKHPVYYIWQALTDTDEKSVQKYLSLISNTHCTHLQRMDDYDNKYISCIGDDSAKWEEPALSHHPTMSCTATTPIVEMWNFMVGEVE